MIPLRLPAPSTAPNEAHENEQRNKRASSFSDVKIFYRRELLKQPFLPELRAVINASYRDHDINPIGKIGYRLQTDTQIADEIDSSGFTAVATVSNEIVGTASVKPWVSKAEGVAWKPRGYYEGKNANEVLSMHSPCLDIHNSDADSDSCEGDFEILLVAVKPGVQYRKRGIAEGLVRACEDELHRKFKTSLGQSCQKTHLRIMLKVVREINGEYWLKKGFRVVGECYCAPFTWDLENAFILWAMRKDLFID
jgi:hypothetical protein